MTNTFADYAPAAAYIKCDARGAAYIEGLECTQCNAKRVKAHVACPACGARAPMSAFKAASTGRIMTYTIVSRSYPGIKVPFVSAFVKLDDGLVLKGVLRNVDASPEVVRSGMPVELVFDSANGLATQDGRPYFSFFFEPLH